MDTLSSFINKRVKSVDELNITKLASRCGMSKAKFYRCLSEPFRFTDSNLETIAQALRLSESDKRVLYEYREGSSQPASDAASEDKASINKIIEDIILGRVQPNAYHNNRIYKLFHFGEKDAGLQLCSAQELVQLLLPFLDLESNGEEKPAFEAMIFNSCCGHATQNLTALVYAIGRHQSFQHSYNISFYHFINDHELESDGRFEALSGLYQIASVSTFGWYSILFADLHETFLGNTDSCLIHFQGKSRQDCYFLINFIREDEVSVYAFTDCNLFSYLSYQYASLKSRLSSRAPRKLNSVEVANYIIENSKSSRGLLITYGPCFDNYLPHLWDGVKARYLHDPDALQKILEQAYPDNSFSSFPPEYVIDKLVDTFQARFHISAEQERITILSAVGLKEFSETGSTSELEPVNIAFTDREIREQLQYLQDNLGKDHAPGQSYYLINDDITPLDTAFVIFDNADIGVYFHETQLVSVYWVILQQPEVAAEFYRHIAVDLIDEKTRSQHRPILLSDDRAKAYIQMLIDQVEARIKASPEEC